MTTDDFIEAPKDRWGRYKINTPAGKSLGYTRVTTISKTTDETSALANWRTRMAITGLIKRPDLLAQASTSLDDKDALNRIAEDAVEAAGGSTRANLGTALHALTQQIDLGLQPTILPGLKADVDAYMTGLQASRMVIRKEFTETLLINDTLQYAGTADRIIELPDGRLVIFDLKTGSNITYSHGNIAVQLAAYANSEWLYDWRTSVRTPLPEIDKTVGVICHLPAGEGRCDFYQVDLIAGLQALQLSLAVREWRKRKDLFSVYGTGWYGAVDKEQFIKKPKSDKSKAVKKLIQDVADVTKEASAIMDTAFIKQFTPPLTTAIDIEVRRDWLKGRITALTPAAQIMLKHSWPADTPRLTDCTNNQLNRIIKVIEIVEAHHTAPFYPPDPTTPKPTHNLTTFNDVTSSAIPEQGEW